MKEKVHKLYKDDFEYFRYDSELHESFSNKTNNRNIVFLTYGDQKFKKSRERIIKEAQNLNFFTDTVLETETLVNDSEFKNELHTNSKFKNVSPSKVFYFPDFKENRHDQSVWSLMCKTNNIDTSYNWKSAPIKPTRIRG